MNKSESYAYSEAYAAGYKAAKTEMQEEIDKVNVWLSSPEKELVETLNQFILKIMKG